MPRTVKFVLAPLALGLLATSIASGQAPAPSAVIDGAGMFSNDATREAKAELAKLDRTFGVTATIETVDTLRGQGLEEFAVRRAEQLDHKGIFVLIAQKERKVETLASPRAFREELTPSRLNAISDAFREQFRKDQIDAGLIKGVQAIASAIAAVRPSHRDPVVTIEGSLSGSSPMVLRQQVRLSLAGARKVLAGAEARSASMGWKMNIAVVDDGGHLLAFGRMDGARPASVATATTKAVSAATYREPTGPLPNKAGGAPDPLLNLSLQSASMASGGKITTLFGGVPIVVDGQVIGAVGVGGGTGEQDAEAARAGVAAFLGELQAGTGDEKPKPRPKDGGEGDFNPLPRRGEADKPAAAVGDPLPR